MNLRLRLALELDRIQRHIERRVHPLRQLFWECTLQCNMHCIHCGSDCKTSSLLPDMPVEDFLKVIDEQITPHTDPHKVMIILSGGEPLMRDDIEVIGQALYQREYPWGMVTNGLLLTEQRLQGLIQSGIRSITVSLDGLKDDHLWMRQNPQAFEGAVRAIKLLTQTTLTWDVVTCVNRRTITKLPQIRTFLWSLGVRNWRLFTIAPMGRAKGDPELLLSSDETRQLLDFIVSERSEGRHVSFSCEGFVGDYEGQVRDYLFRCIAGINVASILIDGHISACTSIRGKYYQGNIYTDNFWDVWEHRFIPYRNRAWMKKLSPCNSCTFFRYCEGGGMHLREENGELMKCLISKCDSI